MTHYKTSKANKVATPSVKDTRRITETHILAHTGKRGLNEVEERKRSQNTAVNRKSRKGAPTRSEDPNQPFSFSPVLISDRRPCISSLRYFQFLAVYKSS